MTYILLPLVVVLWVIIGYRFYNAVKGDDIVEVPTLPEAIAIEKEVAAPYEWRLSYADPFLKNVPYSERHERVESISKQRVVEPSTLREGKVNSIEWDKLKYLGMIRNNKTDKQVGIVTLQGVRKLVREGDRVSGFVIEQIQKDSIRVRYARQKKYVVRQGRIEWLSQRP